MSENARHGSKLSPARRWAIGLAVAAGVVLAVIGARFLHVPNHAARTFGLSNPPGPFDLHRIVGVRDLWLAGLLIGLVLLRQWRGLALCLGLGALVCFADAAIVAGSSGAGWAIAFHVGSGFYCAVAGALAWKAGCETRYPGRAD